MKNDAIGSLCSKHFNSGPKTSGDLKLKSTEYEKRLKVGWFTPPKRAAPTFIIILIARSCYWCNVRLILIMIVIIANE